MKENVHFFALFDFKFLTHTNLGRSIFEGIYTIFGFISIVPRLVSMRSIRYRLCCYKYNIIGARSQYEIVPDIKLSCTKAWKRGWVLIKNKFERSILNFRKHVTLKWNNSWTRILTYWKNTKEFPFTFLHKTVNKACQTKIKAKGTRQLKN